MAPRRSHGLGLFLLAISLGSVVACGSGDDAAERAAEAAPGRTPDGAPDPAAAEAAEQARIAEKPWEVVSNKGETYLANVFYADASENEQIMPYAIDGHVQIDRLVYPTIGNPNLYAKADATDELVVVLRVEDAAFDFLSPKTSPVKGSTLSRVELAKTADGDGFVFYLVPRAARAASTTSPRALPGGALVAAGVVAIQPTAIFQNPMPADMPERLAGRRTLRFVFDSAAMAGVAAGLYDLRFEVKKDGALYEPRGIGSGVYEYQYNAVRVFETEPDEYDVVNVTDTQVSIGSSYDGYTKAQLEQLVDHLASTKDASVTAAPFMTFNGDLHNGGSPASLRQRTVAHTYEGEAKATLEALARLPMPVFLTAGNHDGYVSVGQVPSAVRAADAALFDDLKEIVEEASPRAWPGFSWDKYAAYLDATSKADMLGGFHRDVFVGAFSRNAKGQGFADGWKEVPREKRNMVLYDGFHQWQKTYGPLYASWRFGKNRYVSLNSFELRQHRRTGWGMYTVNYGGGMSDVQMDWLDRELVRAKKESSDVVLLAHHDPRGGHRGQDHGYYFEQLDYRGVAQSTINYLYGKVWNPTVCSAPEWALPRSQEESCVHDGLQEWMRPDEEFDCTAEERIPTDDGRTICETALFDPARGGEAHAYFWSGLELMKRISQSPQVRTVLLGHTHYNELEILQSGDALVPDVPPLAGGGLSQMAWREVQNPMRGYAIQQETTGVRPDYDANAVPFAEMEQRTKAMGALLEVALPRTQHVLEGSLGGRELVILRTVSNADLATQTWQGSSALGYAVLHVRKTASRAPQIDGATFIVNNGKGAFVAAADVAIDRSAKLAARAPENPVAKAFRWK